jgi:hypothetical protein
MNRETRFYNALQEHRVRINDYIQRPDLMRVSIYIDTACELARALEIEQFPVMPLNASYQELEDTDVRPSLYQLERFVNILRARNIHEIDRGAGLEYVVLDDDWKIAATTYVEHIRQAVRNASMNEALRESIFDKLGELQREIDRNRTRVEAFSEMWLQVSAAMGEGAENLGPVAKLLGKLAGPLVRLRRRQGNAEDRMLPPPDALGLPDLSKDVDGDIESDS